MGKVIKGDGGFEIILLETYFSNNGAIWKRIKKKKNRKEKKTHCTFVAFLFQVLSAIMEVPWETFVIAINIQVGSI